MEKKGRNVAMHGACIDYLEFKKKKLNILTSLSFFNSYLFVTLYLHQSSKCLHSPTYVGHYLLYSGLHWQCVT